MKPRLGHISWIVGIFLTAFSELYFLPKSLLPHLFAALAVVLCGWAIRAELPWPQRSAGQLQHGGQDAAPPFPAPGPGPFWSPPPGPFDPNGRRSGKHDGPASETPGPVVGTRLVDSPRDFPAPPRFGTQRSRANNVPWILPARPAQSGVAADEAKVGEVSVRAASVVGPGHRCDEPAAPRQDAYRLGRDRDGRWLVVAVADGISGSAHSELGAAVAAEAAVDVICDRLSRSSDLGHLAATDVFSTVAVRMASVARARMIEPRDTSSVLIATVIEASAPTGTRRGMWVGWVGDVSAWVLANGAWAMLAGDDKAERDGMASNVVNAYLPADPQAAQERLFDVAGGSTLAFVTDGVGDALARIPKANAYFAERWSQPPTVTSFLNDVCYEAKGFQDDRTAVVVWTPPSLVLQGANR